MGNAVLIVEDEDDIAGPLVRALQRDNYDITRVNTGAEGLAQLAAGRPDVLILDLGLPDIDGLEVCRRARESGFAGGIMILTARAGELDRVVGLDYGADDYMSKPFGLAELQARVRALLRRTGGVTERVADDSVRIDVEARRVYLNDGEIALTGKEFDVLVVLMAHRDKVVPRARLMAEAWTENWFGSTKTLDVTIGRLRAKLSEAGAGDRIVAVRGVGFRLETASARA